MRNHVHKTAQLGELVVTVFDEAAKYSAHSPVVSRLAMGALMHILRGRGGDDSRVTTNNMKPVRQA